MSRGGDQNLYSLCPSPPIAQPFLHTREIKKIAFHKMDG
jgi:hypothetical protein